MQKPFVFSYSIINTYLICPHQMYRRYVKKDLPFVETKEMRWGNEVHTAFEYRVGGGKPLPVNMQQWESIAAAFDGLGAKCELKLGVTAQGRPTGFFEPDVFLRGKVDVTIIKNATAFLPDWKSGRSREDPFELEVLAVLTHAANPYLQTIKGAYVWLKENRIGQQHDLSDTRSTWARVNNLAEEIKDCMSDNVFEKRQGPLCKFCNVKDCEFNRNADA